MEPYSELWEKPVYKRLAASELGAGHTSGIVPTTDTQSYFGEKQKAESHLIKKIFIDFWYENKSKIITTNVNYFKSGTHDHIHLTGNLLPAYKSAGAEVGDLLIFWKSKTDENSFKAELVKPDSVRGKMLDKKFFNVAGGFLNILPPNINPSLSIDHSDEEEKDYEITSSVEEDITKADFPTTKKKERVQQGARLVCVRNKAKGDFVLKQQNYKCQVDQSHKSFTTPAGLPYMEKHHLIPMKYYDEYENDLDDINNILSLCPNCHRHIHLGDKNEVAKTLEVLYSKQITLLESAGLPISFDGLKGKYGI
jgi:5-methylcytosine-specific restriction protein A